MGAENRRPPLEILNPREHPLDHSRNSRGMSSNAEDNEFIELFYFYLFLTVGKSSTKWGKNVVKQTLYFL